MLQFQPAGFRDRRIATRLGEMVYYTTNDGERSDRPPLIFLHSLGAGSSAYEWSRVYPAFGADYTVIAPDLIGWGASAHPQRTYQAEDYLMMMRDLIQTTTTPAIVAASSLTAGLVIRLAIQAPELFQSLILVVPSGYRDFGQDYRQGMAAGLVNLPGLDQWLYQLGVQSEWAIRTVLQQLLFARGDRVTAEMVAAYLASAQQPQAEWAALATLKGNLCFDLALYVPQLQVPTLLLWGEQARFSPAAVGLRLAALNPQVISSCHVIPDTGVLPHLEAPAIVIDCIQHYLNSRHT